MKLRKIMLTGIVLSFSAFLLSTVQGIEAEADGINNVDHQMNKISDYYFENNLSWKIVDAYRILRLEDRKTNMREFKMDAKELTDITYTDVSPEYIGENIFTNTTDRDQIYTTATYSHTFGNTSSTAVSKGFAVSGKSTVLQIPMILPGGIEIKPTINASTTNATTTTDTKTYKVGPQIVKVPAHKKYKVEVIFLKKNFQGKIDFSGVGKGITSDLKMLMSWQGSGGRPDKIETKTYKTIDMWNSLSSSEKNSIDGIKFDNNDSFTVQGTASISGLVGTTLEVNTYDITDKSTPLLVSKKYI